MYDFFFDCTKIEIDYYHIIVAGNAAARFASRANVKAHDRFGTIWTCLKHNCLKLVDCSLYYSINMI